MVSSRPVEPPQRELFNRKNNNNRSNKASKIHNKRFHHFPHQSLQRDAFFTFTSFVTVVVSSVIFTSFSCSSTFLFISLFFSGIGGGVIAGSFTSPVIPVVPVSGTGGGVTFVGGSGGVTWGRNRLNASRKLKLFLLNSSETNPHKTKITCPLPQ